MDKFAVYHHIKNIQSVAQDYCEGNKVAAELASVAEQISTKKYRVAVIGEFKRGKSSLVNCILGTQLLPTDVLPTTAVVNRIVYGTESKIEINYKDGKSEIRSVQELSDYATKLDKEKELRAQEIREIVISYPSVFCQNNIELLDTPGLNDDEFMDKTTMDVLDKIDTAIVVTKADIAVSETEKNLICRLIEQDDIYNLTFVVTFMDRVMDDDDEEDGSERIIRTVESRLKKDTYEMFCKKHANDEVLLKKAERILQSPIILPVSSKLAMLGFTNDNKKLLEKSNFPYLKNKLMEILTANQEKDMLKKAVRLSKLCKDNFIEWHTQTLAQLEKNISGGNKRVASLVSYEQSGCPFLQLRLSQVKTRLEDEGIFAPRNKFAGTPLARHMEKIFMYHLLAIDASELDFDKIKARISAVKLKDGETAENRAKQIQEQIIQNAIRAAFDEISVLVKDGEIKERVLKSIGIATDYFIEMRKRQNVPDGNFEKTYEEWKQITAFPKVDIPDADDYFKQKCFIRLQNDTLFELCKFVHNDFLGIMAAFMEMYQDEIENYISSWRLLVLKQDKKDRTRISEMAAECRKEVLRSTELKAKITSNYAANLETISAHGRELLKITNNI